MSTSTPEIGDILLDRYRLDAVLGSGGVGVVFAATDQRLNRPVAIKVLRTEQTLARATAQRFEREAHALAALEHPHLVRVLDYAQLGDGPPIMVMEHVAGEPLSVRLRKGPMLVAEVHAALLQILDALETCHKAGVVHRDLKPGNVLVDGEGEHLKVKLIDLGIAQMVSDEGATALTLSGEVFGSPRFMAPEQWLQDDVDGRTDLYALGLLGYCMLAGRHFIKKGGPVEVWQAHMNQARPQLKRSGRDEAIPPAMAAALSAAAQPPKDKRPADAAQMRAMIDGVSMEQTHPPIAPVSLVSDMGMTDGSLSVAAIADAIASTRPIGLMQTADVVALEPTLSIDGHMVANATDPAAATLAIESAVAQAVVAIEPADSAAKTVAMVGLTDEQLLAAAPKRAPDTLNEVPTPILPAKPARATQPMAAAKAPIPRWAPWAVGAAVSLVLILIFALTR